MTNPRDTSAPVTQEHFRLLQEFGRNELQRKVGDKERDQMWEFACKSARIPIIAMPVVVAQWKLFVGGVSKRSGIAMNGDIDPFYTTLGVTWDGNIYAAHTTKTSSLLKRVTGIFAKSFKTREAFLNAIEKISKMTADRVFGAKQ